MRKIVLLLCLSLAACSAPEKPQRAPEPQPEPTAPAALPAGHPPVPAAHAAPTGVPPTAPSAGGLTWDSQPPLVRQAPKSSMRAAQYGIEGDDKSELSVFYFGSDQGGSVEANISRWLGQIKQADGSDTASKAKRSERVVSGMTVSLVEAGGVFGGGMAMPGAPAPAAIEDALMLGAIAQGPQGSVFFKLVGPRAAVERARPAFDALIGSLRPAP